MSPVAPANRKLADTIKSITDERYRLMAERVLYLDQQGEVQLDLQVASAEPGAIGAARNEFLAQKSLSAVVHLSVMLHRSFRVTVVEIFDDPAHPTFHALDSFYDEDGNARHRWVSAPTRAMDVWTQVWEGKEEEET